jgi:hypothetical protein
MHFTVTTSALGCCEYCSALGWQWTYLVVSLLTNSTYFTLAMKNTQFRVGASSRDLKKSPINSIEMELIGLFFRSRDLQSSNSKKKKSISRIRIHTTYLIQSISLGNGKRTDHVGIFALSFWRCESKIQNKMQERAGSPHWGRHISRGNSSSCPMSDDDAISLE